MKTTNHYTFGDNELARERLRLLADVYEPASRALLARLTPRVAPRVVADLGCGVGYTTALLRDMLEPERLVGVDCSAAMLAAARALLGSDVELVEHDVAAMPLPLPRADLLYARFLLTHLRDVPRALAGWGKGLAPSGYLAVEEVSGLHSDDPVLCGYYAAVERMQAHYGQELFVGRALEEAAREAGLCAIEAKTARLEVPASRMARLHAYNAQTWKDDPFVQASFEPAQLDSLRAALEAIASGRVRSPPVVCELRQLVLRRQAAA